MDRSGRRLSGPAIVISPCQGLLDPDPRDDLSVRIRSQSQLVITVLLHLLRLFPFLVGGHRQLALENLALRQQLAVYERTASQPELRDSDRLFWPGCPGVERERGYPRARFHGVSRHAMHGESRTIELRHYGERRRW
jgi:hypothetical protein